MSTEDATTRAARELREALMRLYDDKGKIPWVMKDAGIAPDNVRLEGSVREQWFAVVEEAAKRDRVRALLEVALREYPDDAALLALRDGLPVAEAVLVVNAIDRYRGALRAHYELDWVNLYEGAEPMGRRRLRDPSLWDTRLTAELADADQALRRAGQMRVRVEGHMRLMTAFRVGVQLARTRGFTLSIVQNGVVWSTERAAAPCALRQERTAIGAGEELAVAVGVTNPCTADVGQWLRAEKLPVGTLVELAGDAVGKEAIRGPEHARGWAEATIDAVRSLVRETRATRVHLFASAPNGLMLLTGHLWNALPPARLYEHTPPGYTPTFSLAG